MRVLIDTNNLLRSIPRKSRYRWLWDLSEIEFPKVVAISIDEFKDIVNP